MKLLLAFVILVFIVATRAARKGRQQRAWVLLMISVVVTAAYLAQRTY
jgi:hypothetical protein